MFIKTITEDKEGNWHTNVYACDRVRFDSHTNKDRLIFFIDLYNSNVFGEYRWVSSDRSKAHLYLMNDSGKTIEQVL